MCCRHTRDTVLYHTFYYSLLGLNFQISVPDHDGLQLKATIFSVLENLVLEDFLLAFIPHASLHSALSFGFG
jgi:hypothetical protein